MYPIDAPVWTVKMSLVHKLLLTGPWSECTALYKVTVNIYLFLYLPSKLFPVLIQNKHNRGGQKSFLLGVCNTKERGYLFISVLHHLSSQPSYCKIYPGATYSTRNLLVDFFFGPGCRLMDISGLVGSSLSS
jgi:hypothetical protein